MDGLERAIIASFDETGAVDSVLKSEAIRFCQQTKGSPTICRLCVEKLRFCQIVQVQFWCLQTLHDAIRVKYSLISAEEKDLVRKSVFSIACYDEEGGGILAGPAFIKNKLAQVIVTLIYFEYPLISSSVFLDFLPHLSKGEAVIDMFCRILNALDDELISLDYPRSNEEVAVAAQVKDAMRQQCVPQIVRACYDILSMYRNSDSEICATVLDTLRRYISWIDIGLIANDIFLPFLFELMLFDGISEQFRGAAAGCMLAVVSKRMDPQSKLSLLKNVQISRVFGLVSDDSSSELASRVASLLTGYAVEVLECTKRLTERTKQTSFELLDEIGREEEDRMVEYRKDFFVLLRSIGRVAPDITQAFIRNSLDAAVTSSGGNIEEVEAALSLLYALGESLSEETIRSGRGLLSDLVPMLLASRFTCHSNRIVALVYLDTITRYAKFVQENSQFIPMLLAAFLDERGIHHPNINVGRRASYLFMRVVKSLKSNLVPYIETILQSLQDTVAQFTNVDYSSKALSGSEDGTHIFEAIGILIGMEDVPLEKQSGYLSSLLTPLCHQVEGLLLNSKILTIEEAPRKIATIQQVIMAINALSKGFSERLVTASRPAIGLMFKRTLDVLLQILVVYPKIEPLRSKVMSFIHRMVDTLGASVFPYLPKALEQLLAEIEPKEMVSFLVLLNQIICKFNNLAYDVLEEVFPAIAGRIFSIIPREVITSGPGANTEEIREIQELQQTLYTFLYDIVTHDLSSVPGFQKFMVEAFATNCCLYSVLDRSFEFQDANTVS
ncbi:Exportin-T (Exportin(tRNA)) (tRNA exportin) [Psidium guajava]|nr:Exportin-T (Exportin(tRNA)) (tRNA exportin) [Psidium guajava]